MLREDQTCPKCGALVTPQLTRCRQCNYYLHGSQLEGLIIEAILPRSMSASPGTSLLSLYIILYYVLMVMLAGPESLAGFRSLALLQLGLTTSTEIQDLELWRFVSSVFAHASLLHIFFNLYALSIVGPLVEQLYDRKRIIVFFVATGTISMFGSYAYRMFFLAQPFFMGSVGASGAVSGLLGLAWWVTRQPGNPARGANPAITRWLVMLILWGFIPGIDAAAHLVGVGTGILFGWLWSPGAVTRRWEHRLWTSSALLAITVSLGSGALTLATAKGYPYQLDKDMEPLTLLFFTIEPGTYWRNSGQFASYRECIKQKPVSKSELTEAIRACELAIRAVPSLGEAHLALSALLAEDGQTERAKRQQLIGMQLRRN